MTTTTVAAKNLYNRLIPQMVKHNIKTFAFRCDESRMLIYCNLVDDEEEDGSVPFLYGVWPIALFQPLLDHLKKMAKRTKEEIAAWGPPGPPVKGEFIVFWSKRHQEILQLNFFDEGKTAQITRVTDTVFKLVGFPPRKSW